MEASIYRIKATTFILLAFMGIHAKMRCQVVEYDLVANKDSVFNEIRRKVEMGGGIYSGTIIYVVTINANNGEVDKVEPFRTKGVSQSQFEITTKEVRNLNMKGQCRNLKTCRLFLPIRFSCSVPASASSKGK